MKYCLLILIGLIAISTSAANAAPTLTAPIFKTIHPVIVHFPRMPISGYNFSYTYNVNRNTTNLR